MAPAAAFLTAQQRQPDNARRAGENARFAGGSISKVANKSCFFKRMQKGREEVDLAVDRCVRR